MSSTISVPLLFSALFISIDLPYTSRLSVASFLVAARNVCVQFWVIYRYFCSFMWLCSEQRIVVIMGWSALDNTQMSDQLSVIYPRLRAVEVKRSRMRSFYTACWLPWALCWCRQWPAGFKCLLKDVTFVAVVNILRVGRCCSYSSKFFRVTYSCRWPLYRRLSGDSNTALIQ